MKQGRQTCVGDEVAWAIQNKSTEWGHCYFLMESSLRNGFLEAFSAMEDDWRVTLLHGALGIVAKYCLPKKGRSGRDQDQVAMLSR